jgi:hypothetical protein
MHMRIRTIVAGSVLAALTATIGLAPSGSAATPATASSPEAAHSARDKYYYNVWADSWSHWTPDWYTDSHAGTLRKGRSYFYCQTIGLRWTDPNRGYTNFYWALTDDDSGNKSVYISVVYISAGGNDEPIPGLPIC